MVKYKFWNSIVTMLIGLFIFVVGLMLIGGITAEKDKGGKDLIDSIYNGLDGLKTLWEWVPAKYFFSLKYMDYVPSRFVPEKNIIKTGLILSIYIGPIIFLIGAINLIWLACYLIKKNFNSEIDD